MWAKWRLLEIMFYVLAKEEGISDKQTYNNMFTPFLLKS